MKPEILFLDEPTKGIDNEFKFKLAEILRELKESGVTIVMVSHDIEFCGRYGDRCAMFFDGRIITVNTPRKFFSGNSFYTTAANRMSRHIFDNAVNVDDVVELVRTNLGKTSATGNKGEQADDIKNDDKEDDDGDDNQSDGVRVTNNESAMENELCEASRAKTKKPVNQVLLELLMAVLAAATIYVGFYVFDNKQYMAVCLLLIVYAMIPFFAGFERRKPKAREIVILAVLIAVATVGRAAFFMIPNFKPVLAIVIISGVALGKESGFLVGAMSAFVSNFLFGQGPWTPWQMIAMAVVGYLAGLIFHRFSGSFNRPALVAFGAIAAFVIYGLIVDLWTILVMTPEPTLETAVMVYSAALYFNLIHAAATVIFLILLAKPMIGKLERVKMKYGMGVFSA